MPPEKRKGGRPRLPDGQKKVQVSLYLTQKHLDMLYTFDDNLSHAIEKFVENYRAALRGAAILEELRQQRRPSALAAYVHLQQLNHAEIPAAVERLLVLLGEV